MENRGTTERRAPRRLFSFDSVKSSSTRHSSSETTHNVEVEADPKKYSRAPSQASNYSQAEGNSNWTQPGPLTESPLSLTPRSTPFGEREKRKGPRPLPPILVDATAQSVAPDVVLPPSPSGSSVRWNSIRQHVLQPHKSVHSQPSSASLASLNTQAAARTAHAKQSSKFAQRLGFRNVVDQAKQVMVDDMHQFATDIQRACMAAHHVELLSSVKSKIDPIHNTVGSSLSLPFMSSSTLATVASGGGSTNHSRADLRQPSHAPSIVAPGRVRPLYQTLLNNAGPFADGSTPLPQLPLESLVLSTLLIPFLTTERASSMEKDRWIGIEAFQIITKTWNPTTEIVAAERSLWCVKAALSTMPPMRTRILSALWAVTVPEETHYPTSHPKVFQTLLHGLFLLLPWVTAQAQGKDTEDSKLLSEIIAEVCAGSCGRLDDLHVEEEYNALFVDADTPQCIRDAVIIEALAKCLEYSADSTRRWLLRNSIENIWSFSDEVDFTPLLTAIHSRALHSFTRASLALLSATVEAKILRNDGTLIVKALESRVFPELRSITNHSADDARRNVVLIALHLVALEASDLINWSISTIVEWYRQMPEWKDCFEKTLKSFITESPWLNLLKILPPLIRLSPEDMHRPLAIIIMSSLNNRLVDDPPPYPCLPLSSLLDTLSQSYPQIFYKPLFLCAASSREHVVVNHLCVLTAIARFIPDFWIKDAEMMSIAIMGNAGGPGSGPAKDTSRSAKPWGTARLGQSVLIVELIAQVQSMRRARENSTSSMSDSAFTAMAKFSISLEQRLNILIETRERTTLIPLSQRLLYCMLFREIRLLTRSLKNAPWLPRFVEWFVSYHRSEYVNDDSDVVTHDAITQIETLYTLAQTGGHSQNNRRSTVAILSPPPNTNTFLDVDDKNLGLAAILTQRAPVVKAIAQGFEARALKLLVAMSGLITADDCRRIGSILWEKHLEDSDPKILSSVCFLVMQSAEKSPHNILAAIEVDLRSSSDETRLGAIQKMGVLANWRFQIMSQHVIADRAHRPFKVARGPLPFVTTDMGSGLFVLELDPNDVQGKLPLELRKKLAEIGWDDDESPVNQQLEWIRTPMSNLPALQMEKLDIVNNNNAPSSPGSSPLSSPSRSPILGEKAEELGLLRRNSTSGGPLSGLKRRPIFVPTLSQALPRIAEMSFDHSFEVAYAARNMIFDLMRNDPGLLTRPVWDLLTGEGHDLPTAVTSLRAFLHSRQVLPPAMAHIMLNTLAGFLKLLAKQSDDGNPLHWFAQIVPSLAKLVPQVYEMSLRELRRAKVDMFLVPSGSLWFPPSAPAGPMFPRGPGNIDDPFKDVTNRIVCMTMIRIGQNMLFLAMLKRNPAEVQVVRKSMAKLVFPSITGQGEAALDLKDFVPMKGSYLFRSSSIDDHLWGLSLMLSRSYILLIAQIFRCLSRHLNDRNELAVLVDSLNRILLAHGNDVGVVAQTLIGLMVAGTRFRRLFASGGGYALFMPVLFKVYAESEAHRGIRDAIEYAVNRFYAYHEETFVFQSLDAIAHVLVFPDIDQAWIAKNVYTLFASLRRNSSPSDSDMAGIHNANKNEEREALLVMTAEEKPQTFFASLRPGGTQQNLNTKTPLTIDLPAEFESKRLAMDDFIRLFLTVIAHDLSIARAEQFLKLFRHLVPSFYHASISARSVLEDGLNALGAIMSRPMHKNKPTEFTRQDEVQADKSSLHGLQMADLSKLPSDLSSMRLDYLWSLVAFAQAGGRLSTSASRTALDLAKAVLRESATPALRGSIASFLGAFSKHSMMPEGGRSLKAVIHVLRDLAPIVNTYALTIDFTEIFDTIGLLSKDSAYFNEPMFCQLVVNQICGAGLTACHAAASEGMLQSFPSRRALISLIANAVLLPGADIFLEIEAHKPDHTFLALFVLPLALTMKTLSEMDADGVQLDMTQRSLQARAWSRLLLYLISCCRRSHGPTKDGPLERSKSQDKRSSVTGYGSHLPSLLIALQAMKIVVIRASEDLNYGLPDIWSRLAIFLREVLGEGNAEFSLRTQDPSPFSSPTASPRTSNQFDASFAQPMSPAFSVRRSFASPRILDYSLWSFLELLCVYRNPLFVQLRAFIHEKVRVLDQELRYRQNIHTPLSSRSRRPSSVFTKPRRRMSNISASNSPDASPHLTALATPDFRYSSAYQNIPPPPPLSLSSPGGSPHVSGPRIVHLGLVANSQRSVSPAAISEARYEAKSTKVKSLVLIRRTYLRIRVVQCCMGYQSELLPLPQTSLDSAFGVDDAPVTIAWTKRRALQEVTGETRDLFAEFEESLNELESEGVLVGDDSIDS